MIKTDVVIIGSGISALTSAILLGQKGHKVIVLEQAAKPGGYMHSFRRFGLLYDTGAHYVGAMGEGQPFRVLLEYLNVYADPLFTALDPKGFDVLNFPFGKFEIPQGHVVKYFPTYEFSDESQLNIPAEAFEVSLESVVKSLTSNSHLQCILYAYCNLHGVKPEHVAFGFHSIVTDSLIRGPYGLGEGGGDALTQSFIRRIEGLGGQVLTKHRVTELRVKDRQISEVITQNDEIFTADWVISTIHPKHTFQLLTDRSCFKPAFFERLASIEESVAIFGVYAAVTQPANIHPQRNYYFFDSEDPSSLFRDRGPNEKPGTVFLTSPHRSGMTAKDKSATGKSPICLHAPGPMPWFNDWRNEAYGKRSEAYLEFKNNYAAQIFQLTEAYNPELGQALRGSQYVCSSALTNVHFNSAE